MLLKRRAAVPRPVARRSATGRSSRSCAARGAWLYDHTGRAFLDGVNNVCHVGHAHPHVVDALARQAAVLNTNTRYLHRHDPRLCRTAGRHFPEPLSRRLFRELRRRGQRARAAHGAHGHRAATTPSRSTGVITATPTASSTSAPTSSTARAGAASRTTSRSPNWPTPIAAAQGYGADSGIAYAASVAEQSS